MEPRYPAPRELVEALQEREPGARPAFAQLLREPLARLMQQFIIRHGLGEDRDLLALHALHAAETYVRTQPAMTFEGMSWSAFRNMALLHVAKVAFQPYGQTGGTAGLAGPLPLPESPLYSSRTFFRPYERLGNHWFGGDWFAGRRTADGSLWVLIADITGHGYYAYLLAAGLPAVWQRCWATLPPEVTEPAQVLAAMHDLLDNCLPEGVFVECTLARLGTDGQVVVAPAGGTRLWLRCGGANRPALLKLRGMWLGLSAPSVDEQHGWTLGHDDELLLASDGVFDQLTADGAETVALPEGPAGTLFDSVEELLQRSLAQGPQKDDLTMVLLRRRAPAGEGRNGTRAGDVPV